MLAVVANGQTSVDPTSATASLSEICIGQSTILTLNDGGGGTNEVIQWYTGSCGGTSVGNGNDLSINPSATTTYFGRYEDGPPVNHNSACATVTVNVNPIMPVSVSIGASATTICSGTPVTFTATPSNGGPVPVYQWKVNGTIAGTNNPTYTYTPVNNDIVTCELTSDAVCSK